MNGERTKNSTRRGMNGQLLFLQQFLKHPLQIGSIIPSSAFLERRIVSTAQIASTRVIVELGPGTGGTTRALLRAMPANARLLSIEINPKFYERLSSIEDERLIAHLGSAENLEQILALHDLGAPDAVVSGIPFSTMDPCTAQRILSAVHSSMARGGRFLAYQVSDRVATLCKPILGSAHSAIEYLNIPPMRVFLWEKPVA